MKNLLLPILAAGLVAFGVAKMTSSGGGEASHKESAYERVMRTGVLRCGYVYWEPCIRKNPQGEHEGMCVDIANAAANVGEFKVDWVGPLEWGNIVTDIESGKIDALCVGMWESGLKAKQLAFTLPFAYEGLEAFVRKGDARFKTEASINSATVTIAEIDNDNTDYIARALFPKAKRVSVLGSDPELLMNVMAGKADVTFSSLGLFMLFDKANPGKLERAMPNHFLRVLGNTPFVVSSQEPRLLNFLQILMNEIGNAGTIDRILNRYSYPFIRKAKPYQEAPR